MSTLAERQLAAWQAIAKGWQGVDDYTTVRRCRMCGQGMYLITGASGKRYRYTDEQLIAMIVLHLRNHHPDLDPDTG